MATLVVGVKRLEQVKDALSSLDVQIPCEHRERVDRIFPPPWKQSDPIRDGQPPKRDPPHVYAIETPSRRTAVSMLS